MNNEIKDKSAKDQSTDDCLKQGIHDDKNCVYRQHYVKNFGKQLKEPIFYCPECGTKHICNDDCMEILHRCPCRTEFTYPPLTDELEIKRDKFYIIPILSKALNTSVNDFTCKIHKTLADCDCKLDNLFLHGYELIEFLIEIRTIIRNISLEGN